MAIEKLKYLVTADTKGFSGPIKAIGALAVTAFVAAVKVTAEFEKELSKLRAVSGASASEMGELEKESRRLGKTTAFTAREVASLQVELAKLGFTTNDILNSSGGVLSLSAALGSTLSDAAALTGGTLKAFGLTTEETGRVVDVLAKSAATSGLDFEKLRESLKLVSPIARAANISFEDTVALLGTLADNQLSGSLAGTSLRKIFIELNAKGLSLNDAYQKINTSSNKLATASDLVGKRAGGALLTLANGIDPTNKLADALRNAEGAAQEMQDIMEDNLIGDFAKLKSAVTEMGITLGQTTDGPLRMFVQGITELVTGGPNGVGLLGLMTTGLDQIRAGLLALQVGFLKFLDIISAPAQAFGLESFQAEIDATQEKLDKLVASINATLAGGGAPAPGGGGVPPGGSGAGTGGPGTGTGPAGPKDFTSQFGLLAFTESGYFDAGLKEVTGFTTKVESEFTKMATAIAEKTEGVQTTLVNGWAVAASTIGSLIGNALAGESQDIGKALIGALGQVLILIGSAVIAAGTALTIFGIGLSAVAAGSIAIGVGTALVAFAGSGGGKKASSGGSSSSSSSPSSSNSPDPRSLQGGGSRGRNVGGYSTRDGDIIPSYAINQASQASDRKYRSLYG